MSTVKVNTDERTPLMEGSMTMDYDELENNRRKKPSMVKVLARVYGTVLLRAHLCKLVYDILTFAGPLLQK